MKEKPKPIDADDKDNGEDGKRQRSTIGFPYTDYESVSAITVAIHDNVGHGECSQGQLAAWTDQSAKSSGFRVQLAAARLFGVIEGDGDNLRLSELGIRVLDPVKSRAARAEAFLRVPLFKALYEKYKDVVTPPAAALEREIVALGVGDKQKARARNMFENSAEQTGFREASSNRLVMPALAIKDKPPVDAKPKLGGNGGGGDELHLDPLLLELLRKIPATAEGWPADKRVRWFRTFAMNVSQVYDPDDAPIELEIDEIKK